MNFAYPELLWVIPLTLLLAIVVRLRSRATLEKKRLAYFLASACLIFIAAARPYWENVPAKEKVKAADLLLVIDVSQSMFSSAAGRISRMDQARNMIHNLLPSFAGNRIGLIYFAGDAQIGAPFSTDSRAISMLIDSISPGMTAKAGTRSETLHQVIRQALTVQTAEKLPVLCIFSDGEFFDSSRSLQRYIRDENLRVFTFLAGEQKAPVLNYDLTAPVPDAFSTPNQSVLQQLAKSGQGEFFRLSLEPAPTILARLNLKIEDMIREGQSVPDYRPVPFLVVALLLLLVYQWLPAQQTHLSPAQAALLLLVMGSVAMTGDESRNLFEEALQAFRNGKQEIALEKLKAIPDGFYPAEKNTLIGNIYYHAGNVDEAIRYYQRALKFDPLDAIARWNWEVALKQQSRSAPPPQEPREEPQPQQIPQNQSALLQYVDQLEKDQRQKLNRSNIAQGEFAW